MRVCERECPVCVCPLGWFEGEEERGARRGRVLPVCIFCLEKVGSSHSGFPRAAAPLLSPAAPTGPVHAHSRSAHTSRRKPQVTMSTLKAARADNMVRPARERRKRVTSHCPLGPSRPTSPLSIHPLTPPAPSLLSSISSTTPPPLTPQRAPSTPSRGPTLCAPARPSSKRRASWSSASSCLFPSGAPRAATSWRKASVSTRKNRRWGHIIQPPFWSLA